MLRVCSKLDFYIQAIPSFTAFGAHVILINFVDTPISIRLRIDEIIPALFVISTAPFMIKSCLMKAASKFQELFNCIENNAASCNIMHSRKLHIWEPPNLVLYRRTAFETGTNGCGTTFGSFPQCGLKGIENISVRGTPILHNLDVFCRSFSSANGFACPIDTVFRKFR